MQTNLGHVSRFNLQIVFTNLPFEIIAEVLKVLDWASLLKIRQVRIRSMSSLLLTDTVQVCKYLDTISRTRIVWEGQYHQYLAGRILPIRLEAPLESYSSEELERWVLVRRSADVGWKRGDLEPVQCRTIEHRGVGSVCIVPGGRWLLVGDTDGSVMVYDLDTPMRSGEPLIPRAGPIHSITIVVDSAQESPYFAFTMTLSTGFYFSEISDIFTGM